ncbi:hypothetical protein [Sphaerisporangium perillae]|uniref:hypothetical protein n=1 Tax=Sphaerisporangium perillae TaxID=2935860 RepID=UPI00200E259F|nr:hypothetical protein [Sphaerisporangium perillae]
MSRTRGNDAAPDPEEEAFDAFAPNPRNSPPSGGESVTSTGSWEAFPTTFPFPAISQGGPPPTALEPGPAFAPLGSPGAVPASVPGFVPAASGPPEPGTPKGPRRTSPGPRERGRLVRALRAAGLVVAAAGLVAATVSVQWWDRSAWVAERYPPQGIKDVGHDQEAILHGVNWKVGVTAGPHSPGQDPGTASLVADVQVTPTSTAEIERSFPPRFTMRDRAGHVWLANAEETPIRSDLKVGQPVRMKVVAIVPDRLRDTAEFVLSYSEREMLRFAR